MESITFFFYFIPLLALILLGLNLVFAPHSPYLEKSSTFECGFHSFLGQNRTQFDVMFFTFGLLFILFDIELVLTYPYVLCSYTNSSYGLSIMLVFFTILTLGFAFEFGKKALTIESQQNKDKPLLSCIVPLTELFIDPAIMDTAVMNPAVIDTAVMNPAVINPAVMSPVLDLLSNILTYPLSDILTYLVTGILVIIWVAKPSLPGSTVVHATNGLPPRQLPYPRPSPRPAPIRWPPVSGPWGPYPGPVEPPVILGDPGNPLGPGSKVGPR